MSSYPKKPLTSILAGGTGGNNNDIFDQFDTIEAADDFGPLPRGVYTAVAVGGQKGKAQTGTECYRVEFRVIEGEYASRRLWLSKPIWSGSWVDDAADMVRADLSEAGLEGVGRDADGLLFLDFHAIGRHTFLTHIARNAPLHVAQKLAGHSSPVVTARYTHAATDDLRAAVEGVPNVMGDSRSVCTQFARTLCKSGHRESSPDADKGVGGVSDALSEDVAGRDVVIPCPQESSAERSTPGGNRTHNRQLRRLLLYPVELQARLSGLFQPPLVAARDLVEGYSEGTPLSSARPRTAYSGPSRRNSLLYTATSFSIVRPPSQARSFGNSAARASPSSSPFTRPSVRCAV